MTKLSEKTGNFFNERNWILARQLNYGDDQITRLENHNPGGVYNTIILNTKHVLIEVRTNQTAYDVMAGTGSGAVVLKDTRKADYNKFIRSQYKRIGFIFNDFPEKMKDIFPKGITVFGTATDAEFITLTETMVTKATLYETDLGTPFLTAAIANRDAYGAAKTSRSTDATTIKTSRSTLDTSFTKLQKQYCTNLNIISNECDHEEVAAAYYYNESLLIATHRKRLFRGDTKFGEDKIVCSFVYEGGKNFWMTNKGAVKLFFQFSLEGILIGKRFEVEPGAEVLKLKFSDFAVVGDALEVSSEDANPGKYQVYEVA